MQTSLECLRFRHSHCLLPLEYLRFRHLHSPLALECLRFRHSHSPLPLEYLRFCHSHFPLPLAGEGLGVRVLNPTTFLLENVLNYTPSPLPPLPQAVEGNNSRSKGELSVSGRRKLHASG
jgi:hypothetical protein